MSQNQLNYRIIIEKDVLNKKDIYVAYAPSLGISDFGNTVELAQKNITKAIELYLEVLQEDSIEFPQQSSAEYFISTSMIYLPHDQIQSLQTKRS